VAKKTNKRKGASQKGLTYKDSGVDIDVGNRLASSYLTHIRNTHTSQVVKNDGGFAGLYRVNGAPGLFPFRGKGDPLLVSGADGVGTKLQIAFALDRHDTVGIDLVAMSVNDILVQGARPLFFLDYIATGAADERIQAEVVKGIADGCLQAGCALLGGETAEHPGEFPKGQYDLAGFVVGAVESSRLITGDKVKAGDVILGLASSGLHSNGYTLARKALLEVGKLKLDKVLPELGCSLGEEMLRPTKIYVDDVFSVLDAYERRPVVKGLVHITGGGLYENVPRILPDGCGAEISTSRWPVPPIFPLIAKCGKVAKREMFRVFNMGIGMLMIVPARNAASVTQRLQERGTQAYEIGRVVPGKKAVKLVR
jgi:phosphoribosylformylglycinamidine cyclo-ligase